MNNPAQIKAGPFIWVRTSHEGMLQTCYGLGFQPESYMGAFYLSNYHHNKHHPGAVHGNFKLMHGADVHGPAEGWETAEEAAQAVVEFLKVTGRRVLDEALDDAEGLLAALRVARDELGN